MPPFSGFTLEMALQWDHDVLVLRMIPSALKVRKEATNIQLHDFFTTQTQAKSQYQKHANLHHFLSSRGSKRRLPLGI
jgi:hypothetical protein